jgi:Flp pilus assembly protein TadG
MRWTPRRGTKRHKRTESMADSCAADSSEQALRVSSRTRRASRGQILILFAGALVGLIGLLGLATDLGYAFAERRTMQNAADAGAISGARAISKSNTASPSVVLSDVQNTAWANKIGSTHGTVTYCQYVDNTDTELGPCSDKVPATASGVHVTVRKPTTRFSSG